jgi:triphosphoribosyl-dephospho-CoA synthase
MMSAATISMGCADARGAADAADRTVDDAGAKCVALQRPASTDDKLDSAMSMPARTARDGMSTRRTFSDADLAQHAVAALIEEAELTPKPALVDGRGSGAHRDLDLPLMRRSARALEATFSALARVARHRIPSGTLRAELAQIGRAGEQTMLQATAGSNAHRGAIWIVGLLVAGAAMTEAALCGGGAAALPAGSGTLAHAARICALGAQIACFPDRFAPPADSHGEQVRLRYRVGGARSEAQHGFPHVIEVGLPALLRARAQGIGENAARVDALLSIMAALDDTCLLHRAGRTGLQAAQRGAQRVLAAGGSSSEAGKAALNVLERTLIALNASPGGAADLLAATLFLDKQLRQAFTGSTATWNI